MTDNQTVLLVVFDSPSESVAQSIALIVNSVLAVVELPGGVHELLLIQGEHLALAQRPVPAEHIEDGGIHVVVAVQSVKGNHISFLCGINIGNPFIVFEYRRTGIVLERNAVPADVAAAGGGHAGGFKNVLLQKVFVGNAGEPFHQQRQQVVAGVGVMQAFPRGEVWLCLCLAEETQDLVVAGDPLFLFPDPDEPVTVVKVIGNSAGVVQKMPDRYAGIRDLREELHDLVLQMQLSLPNQQHDRR